jgi:hypothetical protein
MRTFESIPRDDASRRGGGSEPQGIGEQGCYLPHQCLQTRRFGLDGRQECVTIGVRKLMVVVEDFGSCLNCGNAVQQFLFRRLGCTPAVLLRKPADRTVVVRLAASLPTRLKLIRAVPPGPGSAATKAPLAEHKQNACP